MEISELYSSCTLCAHGCKTDRTSGNRGACGAGDRITLARAALHMWEEPIISGERGSGAIFFSGCSLSCAFCQNKEISRLKIGKEISCERLSEIMLELEAKGAHNINLVTPTHFVPSIKEAIKGARVGGLKVPIVYNTGSYDAPATIKMLEGLVDIYLPDFKYFIQRSGRELSQAPNYPEAAKAAISEMVRQRPSVMIKNGLAVSGVIVRILLLPNHTAEAKLIVKYLHDTYGDNIYISLMSQFTPVEGTPHSLNRRVTNAEYEDLVDYAERLGVKNAFIQERSAAEEAFIPSFDLTGV